MFLPGFDPESSLLSFRTCTGVQEYVMPDLIRYPGSVSIHWNPSFAVNDIERTSTDFRG